MTQVDKELLLKYLCMALPYGVIVEYNNDGCSATRELGLGSLHDFMFDNAELKPYLRPMSSMTEEEKKELQKITNNKFYAYYNYISNSKPSTDGEWHTPHNNFVTSGECNKTISWLDEKHFDHRTDEEGKTLIEKGLAIEVTKENNPYKD